jgi:hypothetical protein
MSSNETAPTAQGTPRDGSTIALPTITVEKYDRKARKETAYAWWQRGALNLLLTDQGFTISQAPDPLTPMLFDDNHSLLRFSDSKTARWYIDHCCALGGGETTGARGTATTARDGGSSMTVAATMTTQQAAAANVHTFTLIFPGHRLAVLEVRGAASQDEARAVACEALPPCSYEVVDGDQTAGRAEIFYSWCSAEAQERQPVLHHQPRQMQQATTARSQEQEAQA